MVELDRKAANGFGDLISGLMNCWIAWGGSYDFSNEVGNQDENNGGRYLKGAKKDKENNGCTAGSNIEDGAKVSGG